MRSSSALAGFVVAVTLGIATAPVHAGEAPASRPAAPASAQHHAQGEATVRHAFDDVAQWVQVFDDPARDAWQKPEALVKALALARGDRVADLGAGTGYFERALARAVGEAGAVYAVEVEPGFVVHLRERAEKEATPNVIPVLGSLDNPRLAPGSVDLVLIVDTYHHIDDRMAYFRRLTRALSSRGRVAVVDFEKRALPVGPPPEHKLAPVDVIAEMKLAGYALDKDLKDLLPYQYVLIFKPAPLQ